MTGEDCNKRIAAGKQEKEKKMSGPTAPAEPTGRGTSVAPRLSIFVRDAHRPSCASSKLGMSAKMDKIVRVSGWREA
jgi:hypothetical protein